MDEEKVYYAIQRIKELSAQEIFKIYNQINNKEKCCEYEDYTLTEKKHILGYIEMMSYFTPELMELLKKAQAQKSAELCLLYENILFKEWNNKRSERCDQSKKSNKKIKSFFAKLTKMFG